MGRRWYVILLAACAGAMLLLASPAAAQLNQVLHNDGWILAAAHSSGLEGSIWRTDLWIYGRTYSDLSVTLQLCEADQDNTSAESFTVTTTGGQRVIYIEDVVDHFLNVGDGSWMGAIHYTASPDVQVWARVYSVSPDGTESYGQLIEGIPTAHMSVNQEALGGADFQQWIFAAKHTADGRYRVNVGVVNPTAATVNVRVSIFAATGNWPSTGAIERWFTLQPYSMHQLTDPFAEAAGGEWSDFQIRVICYGEGGGAFAYASVVDNETNDAFFVRGVKTLSQTEQAGLGCTEHTDGWLLATARAPGYEGSIWRTDLWIRTASDVAPTVQLAFCESGEDGTDAPTYQLETVPGQYTYYIEDAVEHFLHVGSDPWLGAIHYTASADVQVWARVYSVTPDGAATYGQLIEGIPTADRSPASGAVSSTAEYQWMAAAKHTADGRFRANLGIVNPTAIACRYAITVYDTEGALDATIETAIVPPFSMIQLSDPLSDLDGGEWSEKEIRVLPSTPGGGGFAYLSVVDNATNDAYFVRGIKRMSYGG